MAQAGATQAQFNDADVLNKKAGLLHPQPRPIEAASTQTKPEEGASAQPLHRRPVWFTPTRIIVGGDITAITIATAAAGTYNQRFGALYGALVLLCLAGGREYRSRLALQILEEAPRLTGRVLLPVLALAPLSLVGNAPRFSLRAAMLMVLAVLAARMITYSLIRALRRRGWRLEPTVVVGAGAIGCELVEVFKRFPEFGLRPVGIVDDLAQADEFQVAGRLSDLAQVLERTAATHIVVAFGPTSEHTLVRIIRSVTMDGMKVYVVPRFFEVGLAPTGPTMESIWGIPLYRVRQAAFRANSFRVKRIFDVVLSSFALLALLPLLAVVAVAVKLTSPGPVFFRQDRVGQGGRTIQILKFRTMHVNSDSDTQWTVAGDERRTPIGRWLRRTSIDEIPQLWNILTGDMSIVGPRPERRFFVDQFGATVDGYSDRHRLPVGLTGLAQIHGLRGDTSIVHRARFDNYYIENWSPWHDLIIAMRTLGAVCRAAAQDNEGLSSAAPSEPDSPSACVAKVGELD